MKLTIRTKDVALSDADRQYVEDKVISLDKYYSRIIDGFIDLSMATKHHKHGPTVHAAVDLRCTNRVIRAEKNHIDVRAAIDGIKDELKKQLLTYKEEHDAKVKRGARVFKKMKSLAPEALLPVEETGGGRVLNEGN